MNNSYNTDPSGVSSPLQGQIVTETKLINLTSETATQVFNGTYLSSVSFDTPSLLIKSPYLSKVELELLHCEIPVSFYNINYTNSYFKYQLDTDPITTVQVPVGNYNANSLIAELLTLINDANFTITISKITGKLQFHHNKTFIIYTDNQYSIGKVLGFNLGTSYSSNETPNYTLTAPYPLNLLGIKKINISSSRLITNNFTSGHGSNTLLHSLSVDQPAWGLLIYQNTSGIRFNLGNHEIHKIDLQLLDEDQNYINFNNINWSMLFCLHITYDYSLLTPSIVFSENRQLGSPSTVDWGRNPNTEPQKLPSVSPISKEDTVDWVLRQPSIGGGTPTRNPNTPIRNPNSKLEELLSELSALAKK
jgi:hypothetical protein